ncbi:CD276 antigen-like [Alligator mississippiensis]|uniref:CD276 antigen-like n=1 Tax=Alligator mississippiensis TaxID=8496 RepID=A0A151PEI8_ALLMI|nr:CD276 antigen-like [Alligator mississippiensis]
MAVLAGAVLTQIVVCILAGQGRTSSRVTARDGADVLLRCNVPCRGHFDFLGAIVNWQLPGEPSAVVDSFFHGQVHPEHQDARYRGRTQLFPGEFAKGNASLLLRGTTPSDAGNYSCHAVLCAHTPHTQRVVELQVTGSSRHGSTSSPVGSLDLEPCNTGSSSRTKGAWDGSLRSAQRHKCLSWPPA